jgi:hypothetical protein
VHEPAKIVLDLAVTLAVGRDCLADVAVLRAEPGVYGPVASDPTVWRTIDRLAADPVTALRAIHTARAAARARAWKLAGRHAPDHGNDAGTPLIINADATLVTAHSDKEGAAPTFKRGYGHHPLWAFVDHGPAGTGEPLSVLLRPGNAGSQPGPSARQGRSAPRGDHRRGRGAEGSRDRASAAWPVSSIGTEMRTTASDSPGSSSPWYSSTTGPPAQAPSPSSLSNTAR